jgi:hypothetical protein
MDDSLSDAEFCCKPYSITEAHETTKYLHLLIFLSARFLLFVPIFVPVLPVTGKLNNLP